MSKPFSLSKNERLKSKKQIDALFLHGEAFFVFPFKVKYTLQTTEATPELQFGISVPKRNFKKAVDRNRLKRLSRETYRMQKVLLKQDVMLQKSSLQMMFIFAHHEILTFAEIEKAMKLCISKLLKLINKNSWGHSTSCADDSSGC